MEGLGGGGGNPGNQEVLLFGLGQAVVLWSLECILSESRPWEGLTAEAGQRAWCSEAQGLSLMLEVSVWDIYSPWPSPSHRVIW